MMNSKQIDPKLFERVGHLINCSNAVLTMLEKEGRDTGMGGPLSDLRDALNGIKIVSLRQATCRHHT
jgi:hypothetical protein